MHEDIVYLWLFGLATEDDDGESLTKTDGTISTNMSNALREAIKRKEVSTEKVQEILKKYNHTKLSELKLTELTDFKKEIDV